MTLQVMVRLVANRAAQAAFCDVQSTYSRVQVDGWNAKALLKAALY